jgi:hypothetical protein
LKTAEDVVIHWERLLCPTCGFAGFAVTAVVLMEGIAWQLHLNVCVSRPPLVRVVELIEGVNLRVIFAFVKRFKIPSVKMYLLLTQTTTPQFF